MSFSITIKNNESGEVLVKKENAVVIIGAITDEDDNTGEMAFCAANSLDIAVTCVAAQKSISRIKSVDKTLALACKLAEEMSKAKEAESKNE